MFSWLNSIENLVRFQDIMNILIMISGILLALSTIFSILSGKKISNLKSINEAELKTNLKSAQDELILAKSEIDSLETALNKNIQIIKTIKPRSFSAAQKIKFSNLINNSPKGIVEIHCIMGNEETESFGNEIQQLLIDAGWDTKISSPMYHKNPIGLIIGVHSKDNDLLYGAHLQNAFNTIGFPCNAEASKGYPSDKITLTIGLKPK